MITGVEQALVVRMPTCKAMESECRNAPSPPSVKISPTRDSMMTRRCEHVWNSQAFRETIRIGSSFVFFLRQWSNIAAIEQKRTVHSAVRITKVQCKERKSKMERQVRLWWYFSPGKDFMSPKILIR